MAKTATLISLIVLTLGFSSCKEKLHKPADLTVFMDRTTSLPDATITFYLNFINTLLTYLKPGDHLRVLPIDKNTESGSVELVNVLVPPLAAFSSPFDPPSQKNELIAIRFRKFQDSIIKVLKTGMQQLKQRDAKLKEGTDIFGALRVGQKYFDASKTNVLIICSDMLNYSSELKMEHVKLDREFVAASIKRLNPSYHNTNYFGLYCITGVNDQLSPSVFTGAKSFWESYFRQAHFTNTLFVSGETSVIEDKLKTMQDQDSSVTKSFF